MNNILDIVNTLGNQLQLFEERVHALTVADTNSQKQLSEVAFPRYIRGEHSTNPYVISQCLLVMDVIVKMENKLKFKINREIIFNIQFIIFL